MTERNENKLIIGNAPNISGNKATRRKILQAAALGAGSLAAGGIQLAAAQEQENKDQQKAAAKTTPNAASKPERNAAEGGKNWAVISGAEFKPRNSSAAYAYGGAGILYPTSAASDGYSYRLNLPDGARITTLRGYVLQSAAGTSSIELTSYQVYNQEITFHTAVSTTTTDTNFQTLLKVNSNADPIATIDNYNRSYQVIWYPGGSGTSYQLAGVEVGWMGPVGSLNTFPAPARFVDTRPATQVGTLATLAPNSTTEYVMAGKTGILQPGNLTGPTVQIPNGATALVGNVTIVAPSVGGLLKINPGTTDRTNGTSIISWPGSTGNSYFNSFNVALSASGAISLALFCTTSVNIIIDIVGYYF